MTNIAQHLSCFISATKSPLCYTINAQYPIQAYKFQVPLRMPTCERTFIACTQKNGFKKPFDVVMVGFRMTS